MRHSLIFGAVATALLVALPDNSEAFGRRRRASRCQPACPPPVWCYAPSSAPPIVWYPAPRYPQGVVVLPGTVPPGGAARVATQPAATQVKIKGKTYRIIPHPDKGSAAEDERDEKLPPTAAASNIPAADRFMGTSRRVAKTTIFKGDAKSFDTVADLLDWLTDNDTMVAKMIPKAPDSKRVKEEQRNVEVKAYIYAFKKESDNDYHVIVGDAPDTPDLRYLNVEVSGIPIAGTDENRDALWAVRKAFKAALNLGDSGPRSYFRPDPPIPVRITGSLFWDVDHQTPPYVGPNDFKPKTPWEIHPISKIEFLDE